MTCQLGIEINNKKTKYFRAGIFLSILICWYRNQQQQKKDLPQDMTLSLTCLSRVKDSPSRLGGYLSHHSEPAWWLLVSRVDGFLSHRLDSEPAWWLPVCRHLG